jgi:flagellar biogenesis protein FliO
MSPFAAYAIAIAVAAAGLYGVARFFGREPAASRSDAEDAERPTLRVLSRLRLGRGQELVIVEVDERRLLLGAARGQWTALADLGARRRAALDEGMSAFEAEMTRAMNARRFGRGRRPN